MSSAATKLSVVSVTVIILTFGRNLSPAPKGQCINQKPIGRLCRWWRLVADGVRDSESSFLSLSGFFRSHPLGIRTLLNFGFSGLGLEK